MPKAHNVKIYDIDKIIYSKKKLSALEKIDHLQDMKEALVDKMKTLQSGKQISDFEIMSPQEFEMRRDPNYKGSKSAAKGK